MPSTTEKFQFTGRNGQTLDGRLELPRRGAPVAVALFAHCFTCTKQSRAATQVSAALADNGIAVLRFDFTGLGGSEGEFANSGFASNVADLVAAADALRNRLTAPAILIGHSLGGAAVIAAAERIPEAKAVATIGAPFDVEHVLGQLGEDLAKVEAEGEADVHIAGRAFRVDRDFVEQTRNQPQEERIAALGKGLLVMHAPDDDIVGIDNASLIFQAAKHPKSFVSLDGYDHLLTDVNAGRYVAGLIAAWAARYVTEDEEATRAHPRGIVTVESAGGKYTQSVQAGPHAYLVDEPATLGGDDLGPTPYDHLLTALGTCTSITMQMYAARKDIPLQGVKIELEHSRDHVADCTTCNNDDNRIDVMDMAIELVGDLTDAQRARLLEIADKCPVHRTLENRIDIHTTTVG
ncbi:OsmC family protein [Parasphingopyxis algicola]|uniref:bifunctional alpha/beta hydrolase/OsmC family protein n=1 Tax=Parasphingopyxis algicola TaxID=2026624 RepID=UPI0015A145E7|nr:bifunctional alpha/beta hydrolase/OsmC family protein [Parasphingopyxis algicola]QLC24627.1 OsmC family protein [Parasphingopyxis algicola]